MIKRKESLSYLIYAAALALILSCCVIMTSCTEIGAEAQVRTDLDTMRTTALDQDSYDELESLIKKSAREDLGEFASKLRSFEYEILGSKNGEDGSSIVTVRIRTYSFGKLYLESWSDYLKKNGSKDFDQKTFYSMMVGYLSKAPEKDYFREVAVVCINTDDGEWRTDVLYNSDLRDAVYGGMLTEIAELAKDGQ